MNLDDNGTVTEFTDDYTDAVSPLVRTVAYFTAAIGAVTIALIVGVIALWLPEYAEKAMATGGLVTTFLAGVAGVLGVIYRPTQYPTISAQ